MHPAKSSGKSCHNYNNVQSNRTIKCELYPDEETAVRDWHAQQTQQTPLYMNHVVPAPHHISRLSTLSPAISEIARQAPRARAEEPWTGEWELFPCVEYGRGRPIISGNHIVDFRCYGGRELALSNALKRKCDDLVDGEIPALPLDVSAKFSIRLEFPNCVPYTRQVMARRSTNTAEPISRKVLAWKIAEEMEKYLKQTRIDGRPLMFRGAVVDMEQLALYQLRRASSGSWVPVFKILLAGCN